MHAFLDSEGSMGDKYLEGDHFVFDLSVLAFI
jgi:hypothetical protein